MERARVRGFTSKAKFIPRGVAGSRYDGGVNCAVITLTYIFYRLSSTVDQGLFWKYNITGHPSMMSLNEDDISSDTQ